MVKMTVIRTVVLLLINFSISPVFGQQTTMNIYQSNSTVFQIPISTVDSVNFTTIPPPITLNVYQVGGNQISIAIGTIDSITYTELGGLGNLPDYLNPNVTYGNVTDIEGNSYYTTVIGTQEWMSENLRVVHYSNGDPILYAEGVTSWQSFSVGAWGYKDDNNQYEYPYGKWYNGYAAVDSRNVCPLGWHVPNDGDWTIMIDFLGGSSVAGAKLKSTGTDYWTNPNIATDESGFSGLPGAIYDIWGDYEPIGNFGEWWSSTTPQLGVVNNYYLYHSNGGANPSGFTAVEGCTIRCVRD
jgi:uncharacterized protein (TIGR02145 family)